eukprot:4680308-Alexandrium_andersonii.AAC.1
MRFPPVPSEVLRETKVRIMGDSQTVCAWANGQANCTHLTHLPLQTDAMSRMHDCWKHRKAIPWEPAGTWVTHIYRECNKMADHLANVGAEGQALTYNGG